MDSVDSDPVQLVFCGATPTPNGIMAFGANQSGLIGTTIEYPGETFVDCKIERKGNGRIVVEARPAGEWFFDDIRTTDTGGVVEQPIQKRLSVVWEALWVALEVAESDVDDALLDIGFGIFLCTEALETLDRDPELVGPELIGAANRTKDAELAMKGHDPRRLSDLDAWCPPELN